MIGRIKVPPVAIMITNWLTTFPTAPGVRRPELLRRLGPLVSLGFVVVLFGILANGFLTVTNLKAIVDQTSILLIVAIGATFVILIGSIDLSVEGVMATSALSVALLVSNTANRNHFGVLAVLVGIAIGAGFGLANGTLHVVLRMPSFMVTFGMWFVGLGIATVLFAGNTPRITDNGLLSMAMQTVIGVSPITMVAIAVAAIGYFILRYTKLGRYALVIGGNESLARQAGIKVSRYKVYLFTLAGALSGLAGTLAVFQLRVGDVGISQGRLFSTISAVVVGGTPLSGGRGGILNTIVGVLTITTLNNGMVLAGVSPFTQQTVQGAIIVAAVTISTWSLRRPQRVVK